jgi:hypothetical protein
MKALSFYEPYASLLAIGAKKIETRSGQIKYKNYRGPIFIHTSSKTPKWALNLCQENPYIKSDLEAANIKEFTLGAIIGMVTIYDVISLDGYNPGVPEIHFGDYSPGRIGLLMKNPVRFRKPIPWKGHQGLWNFEQIIFDSVGHMISTKNEDHLHEFAGKLGLKREWYQDKQEHPHYDLTTPRAQERAREAGAIEVHPIDLLWILKAVNGGKVNG